MGWFYPILGASGAWLALAAGPAVAATLAVDRPCYADAAQRAGTVTLSGAGYTPGAVYQVTLDGQALPGGVGVAAADGTIAGSFPVPVLARFGAGTQQHAYVLGVQEGDHVATTALSVSRLSLDFAPGGGDLSRLRVRFQAHGLALAGSPPGQSAAVWLHYVDPRGKLVRTVRLGLPRGACGSVRTARRRLFRGAAPRPGRWTLQADRSRTYRRGTPAAGFLYATVGVTVRR